VTASYTALEDAPMNHFPISPAMCKSNKRHLYDYIIKLCRQQAEVIEIHENKHVRGTGHGEARNRKYKRSKLGSGQAYDHSSDYAVVVA
jgi:hypothetical protein